LSYHTAGKADAALLDETLQVIRAEATKSTSAATAEESGEASELAHQLGIYFLAGGREFDVAFAQIATADDPNARFMLARLLGEIGEERARKLLLAMLGDAHEIVQGEVVRGVAKGMPEEVGPVLHEHLVKAAAGGIGPTSIMDPIRNQLDGGRTEIIRALGELRYKAAAPDIIRLLDRVEDVQSLRVSLEALRKMENREYAQALWKPLRNPPLLMTIAEWVRENRVTELKDALLSVVEDAPGNAGGGPHWAAIEALGAIGDEETGARLTAMLQQLTTVCTGVLRRWSYGINRGSAGEATVSAGERSS
jgi:HEAT repeat protein